MRGLKKGISAVVAAALFLTALPVNGISQAYAAGEQAENQAADVNVSIQPDIASKFNDTNQDGWGEFEGWGTSLCWWANRLGYSEELTQQAADVFFSENGLNMNIGRYNIGGGDYVSEPQKIEQNPRASVYGVEGETKPQYGGTEMKVTANAKLKDASYTVSDADFGFAKGESVGTLKEIGWVNEIGEAKDKGDNLRYTVNVETAGRYTVKMLCTLDGTNKRAMAIRLNDAVTAGDGASDQVVSAEVINQNEIARAGSMHLFLVKFTDVELEAGNNLIAVGGKKSASIDNSDGFALNFVKMLVVKSGEEGVVPEEPEGEFLHPSHIKRSDSVVPGYCTDVTRITESMDKTKFDRVDEECGFAWNYDWDADKNQVNILKAAIEAGDGFLAEAFSNSPPYFMTNSGCSSGAVDSGTDNLRADSYHAFAKYMADVITHWAENGIYFQSTTAMNEPDTSYWGANSNKQEGCHFDPGKSQSDIIVALKEELEKKAAAATDAKVKSALENIIISGTDETDIDKAITSYNKLSKEAKEIVTRIDTHTYSGSKRSQLCELAQNEGKNLWMSEVDGAYTAGQNAGEMTAALGLAERIMTDLNGLKSTTWILWNAVDMHVDADASRDGGFDADSLEELCKNTAEGGKGVNLNSGYWGIAIGDHNNQEIVLTKKYEAFGQFSRYIRPGYTIIGSDNDNILAAWDREGKKLVIVAMNDLGTDKKWKFDLSHFTEIDTAKLGNIAAYRTSGSMENGEKWQDVSSDVHAAADADNKSVTVDMKANSITTFIIEGVEDYDADQDYAPAEEGIRQELLQQNDTFIEQNMEEIPLTKDMVTGSAPWNNGTTDVPQNVVDGNYDTFFDGVTNGWVKIDMGGQEDLVAVAYAPRKGYADRCVGASFYGSNDGENWTLLYTITRTPEAGKCTNAYQTAFKSENTTYRYIRYAVPEGDPDANCNVAEIKLYRLKAGAEIPEIKVPDSLEQWVAFYKEKTEGHKYSVSSTEAMNAAMKLAEEAKDEAAKNKARKKLAEAYLGLEEIIDYSSFSGADGAVIRDTNGKIIQAHGGQIQQLTVNGKTKWYWIGEDKTNDYRPCPGIHMYTSEDLYNWQDEGVVLKTAKTYEEFNTDKYFTDLYGDLKTEAEKKAVFTDIWQGENSEEGCVIERPKMLYNDKTGKYVIWFHADGQDPFAESAGGNYSKAKAGVAIADSPTGPYKLLGSYLLNTNEDADHGFDSEGGHVRDMNLFKDDDGSAYVMYSSDGNQTMYIARLNDEYTNVAKNQEEAVEGVDFTRNFINSSREAPAMFKYNGKYYMMTSGCTGWAPNQAQYAVADHPLGPWTVMGDPCPDNGSGTTYDTQSTCIFPVDAANGKFIYMGDRWSNPDKGNALRDSRYVWLPVEFQNGNKMSVRRCSNWTLEDDVFKRNSDKKDLYRLIGQASERNQEKYTAASWEAFDKIFKEVQNVQLNITANQTAVDEAKLKLENALNQLKTIQDYLREKIAANGVDEADRSYYTEESWRIYEIILKETKELGNIENLTEEEAEDGLKALRDAVSVLELKDKSGPKNQVISCTSAYTKVYGDKAFDLNAKITVGNGRLSYQTSDPKVASVDAAGRVTIQGSGICTITITASAAKWYKESTAAVTVTVKPKKAVLSSAKPVKGSKLTVKWKKDSQASGYEIQCSLKKNFKKIAAKTTIKTAGTTSKTFKKLKKGKKYYVRVRAYKTTKVNGKTTTIRGDWSKLKLSGKIKK
ncbi:MAG: family 43 glycosylhydrolase [Lachnospiraceae bacterium]|nr:family 43 glycosylhydrolase [Lachnospiraceae bacterium]